jgi:hypothetical protein
LVFVFVFCSRTGNMGNVHSGDDDDEYYSDNSYGNHFSCYYNTPRECRTGPWEPITLEGDQLKELQARRDGFLMNDVAQRTGTSTCGELLQDIR